MENQENFYVVGIGLSAGGIEALEELMGGLPSEPNAAFVVISHLLPGKESRLNTMVARWTPMQVSWINSGEVPVRNAVHLLPPGKILTMQAGTFQLRDRGPEDKINRAISLFFTSLAEQMQHRSIGVILSGTGTDGEEGVKAIEARGGIVMVQHPASALHKGMPANIISEDHPDFISTPKQISQALMSHLRVSPYVPQVSHE